jgi:dCMP deaminase
LQYLKNLGVNNVENSEKKIPTRPGWDEYFLNMATLVATRSSCSRNNVGAVIVKEKDVISTGYNGAPKYQKNCLELGFCYRDRHNILSGTQLEKCHAVGSHAESNAIALAARNGHSTRETTIYVVGHNFVCNQCKAQIANSEIKRVVLRKCDNQIEEFIPEKDWTVHPIDQ